MSVEQAKIVSQILTNAKAKIRDPNKWIRDCDVVNSFDHPRGNKSLIKNNIFTIERALKSSYRLERYREIYDDNSLFNFERIMHFCSACLIFAYKCNNPYSRLNNREIANRIETDKRFKHSDVIDLFRSAINIVDIWLFEAEETDRS